MRKFFLFLVCLGCFAGVRAQTPDELRALLPEVAGWTIAPEIEVFNPENLFDRINGAAPLFIENNFREMTSAEYRRGDEYITVQAYRHASPEDAFGMYASERSSGMEFPPIGGEAQCDAKSLCFFAGNMYVKMWCGGGDGSADALQRIGKAFADGIDPRADYPRLARSFPAEGKIPHTESYIVSGYIGHEFLNGVYTADYQFGEVPFQAFVIDAGSPRSARELLEKYIGFTGGPSGVSEGMLTIHDRYNGDLPMLWRGRYLAGLFVESGKPVPDTDAFLLRLIAAASVSSL